MLEKFFFAFTNCQHNPSISVTLVQHAHMLRPFRPDFKIACRPLVSGLPSDTRQGLCCFFFQFVSKFRAFCCRVLGLRPDLRSKVDTSVHILGEPFGRLYVTMC